MDCFGFKRSAKMWELSTFWWVATLFIVLMELNLQLKVVNNNGLVFLVLVVVLAFLGVQHGLLAGLWCFLALSYCVGHNSRAFGDHWVSGYFRGVVCLPFSMHLLVLLLCSACIFLGSLPLFPLFSYIHSLFLIHPVGSPLFFTSLEQVQM